MSKVTKDPKKVEAGKKGHQKKLLKLKEEILQEGSTSGTNSGTTGSNSGTTGTNSGTTASNLLSTSGTTGSTSGSTGTNSGTTATNSGTSLPSTSSIFLGSVGVLAIGVYFYMKTSHQVVENSKVEKPQRPMV